MTLPLNGVPAEPPAPTVLRVFVPGKPAPQGSKRAIIHKQSGRAVAIESSKAVKPWREDVRAALVDEHGQPRARFTGAVVADLEFLLPRPKRLAGKPTPPHIGTPDVDKLVRSTFDAVTSAGCWTDDAVVVAVRAFKRYAEDHEVPGAHITITALEGPARP